jgi:hypothetical protein
MGCNGVWYLLKCAKTFQLTYVQKPLPAVIMGSVHVVFATDAVCGSHAF